MAKRLHGPRTTVAWLAQQAEREDLKEGDEDLDEGDRVAGTPSPRGGATGRQRTRRKPGRRRRPVRHTTSWTPWRRVLAVVAVLALVLLVGVTVLDDDTPPLGLAGLPAILEDNAPESERTVDVHAGYGTWVDLYDYLPRGSNPPTVTPATVSTMAAQGVRTLYLQAAQLDPETPELLTDERLLAEFLVQAHEAGMKVVGWYLPRFVDLDRDLAHLEAISEFEVLGHRFDGVGVDIEWTNGIADHDDRSARLVDLSQRLRETVGDDDALAAIVLPPVQIEVVNPNKWPNFPWRELADLYDVWMPMGYWTERQPASGYNDGFRYTDENVRRIRANLDDPDAPVHAIGGIGDRVTADQAQRFVDAIEGNDVIGGSIYDWSTLDPAVGATIAEGLPDPD